MSQLQPQQVHIRGWDGGHKRGPSTTASTKKLATAGGVAEHQGHSPMDRFSSSSGILDSQINVGEKLSAVIPALD